jgi:hypothetical protein
VPKYDPFGREIGEDTLAGLGGGEDASPPAAAVEPERQQPAGDEFASHSDVKPSPVAATPTFEAPAPSVRVRRRGGAGCLVALIVLAVIAAAPIIAIVSVVGSATDAIDEVQDAFDSVPEIPDVPELPADPPSGVRGESLVAPRNFAEALERIGGIGGATMLRLAPERLDAQLARGRRERSVQVTFQGELTRGPATRGGAVLEAIPLSAIDTGAPARLVRGSAARYRVRPRGINYLVLMPDPAAGHRWIAYFKNGIYVQGDRNGRVVRRIS